MPETSVVIRAFNEMRHLPRLFAALERQKYRDFEVVVVDSGSFDGTREFAQQHADLLVDVAQHDFTFGYSLNSGIAASSGRFLAIISAHCAPTDDDWLGSLIQSLRDAGAAMAYGRQIGDASSKFGESEDFIRTFGKQALRLTPPRFFANNANSAVRRDLWERHPFDETLPGLEDIAWAKHFMSQGLSVVYEPKACVVHSHDETWPQVRRRYYREGQAAKWIGVRGRRDLPSEVVLEAARTVGDVSSAARCGLLFSRVAEILRFRWEKLAGTCAGIWDGAQMDNPQQRRRLLFDKSYKAVVIRGAGRAALEDVELAPLKPGEILVRVAYQGVCATDLEVFQGTLGYYASGLAHYPIVPGHEVSGTVAAVGAKVTDLPVGSPVVVECIQGCGQCKACLSGRAIGCSKRSEVGVIGRDGGYAQFLVTARRFVHVVPADISLADASLCEPLAVVMKGLRRLERAWGPSSRPRACAVAGAGAIGHLTALSLKSRGHAVTVIDRDPERLAGLAASGIATTEGLSALADYDAVVEATGDPAALDAILHGTAAGAVILLLGLPYARREFSFETVVGYDKIVVGSVGSDTEDFKAALAIVGRLDLNRFARSYFALEDFAKAWTNCRERRVLKTVLKVDPEAGRPLAVSAAQASR